MKQDLTQGFTFVELMVVIAIIGILAAVLIPNVIAAQSRGYDTGARMCAKSLQTAQGISLVDNQTYVASGSGALLNEVLTNLDQACRQSNIFVRDRSNSSTLTSTYVFDIWDRRGTKVVTVTPDSVRTDAPGATPFSSTGTGGTNFP